MASHTGRDVRIISVKIQDNFAYNCTKAHPVGSPINIHMIGSLGAPFQVYENHLISNLRNVPKLILC